MFCAENNGWRSLSVEARLAKRARKLQAAAGGDWFGCRRKLGKGFDAVRQGNNKTFKLKKTSASL